MKNGDRCTPRLRVGGTRVTRGEGHFHTGTTEDEWNSRSVPPYQGPVSPWVVPSTVLPEPPRQTRGAKYHK